MRRVQLGLVILLERASVALLVAGLAAFGYQGVEWLRLGTWEPLPLVLYLAPYKTGWVGADRIILWVFDTNLGVLMLASAAILFALAHLAATDRFLALLREL